MYNRDPLRSAGKPGKGVILTDRDYTKGFESRLAKNIFILLFLLPLPVGIIILYRIGLHIIASLLIFLIISFMTTYWLISKKI